MVASRITFPANNNITSAPHGTDDEDNATLSKTLTASSDYLVLDLFLVVEYRYIKTHLRTVYELVDM